MKFAEPVNITVETASSVFIGDGDEVRPLGFVLDRRVAHVLDTDRFFQGLTEAEQSRYLEWIDPLLVRLGELDERIRQAGRNRELRRQLNRERRQAATTLSIETFLRDRLRVNPVQFVRSRGCVAYSVQFGPRPRHDGFRTFMKDVRHRPYIPGTELKGALRTALMYIMLEDEANYRHLERELTGFRSFLLGGAGPRDKVRRFAGIAGKVEGKVLRGRKNDAKFDLLKMVQVTDATSISSQALRLEMTQSAGTHRWTKTVVETLRAGARCEFQITLGEGPKWVLERLGLNEKSQWLSLEKLLRASYERSKAILDEEADYFADEPQIWNQIADLQRQNQPTSPLLRLGAGQGFLSTTIGLQIKQRDERLFDEAVREGVSFQRRWRTEPGNFPKTRRVMTGRGDELISLLGWLKLRTR